MKKEEIEEAIIVPSNGANEQLTDRQDSTVVVADPPQTTPGAPVGLAAPPAR